MLYVTSSVLCGFLSFPFKYFLAAEPLDSDSVQHKISCFVADQNLFSAKEATEYSTTYLGNNISKQYKTYCNAINSETVSWNVQPFSYDLIYKSLVLLTIQCHVMTCEVHNCIHLTALFGGVPVPEVREVSHSSVRLNTFRQHLLSTLKNTFVRL